MTWLRSLSSLGDLDPGKTVDYPRTGAPEEVLDRFALTLLHSPDTFGSDFLTELITGTGTGGPAAVSTLLGDVARTIPPGDVAGPLPLHEHAFQLWDHMLDLADGNPDFVSALAGAGRFAFAEGTDEDQWPARTLRTLNTNHAIEFPDRVAERVARSSQNPDALRILTSPVSSSGGRGGRIDYRDHAVIRFAQDAVDTSEPGTEGRAGLGQALGRHARDVRRATAW